MKHPIAKPKLRGWIHQESFFVALGACVLLIVESKNAVSLLAGLIFTFGLLFNFGVSALYHRIDWQPNIRALLRRLDHSAIFVLIAGTFTPVCLLGLSQKSGVAMLTMIWIVAILGIMMSIIWVQAPKWLAGLIYVGMGWSILPSIPELAQSLGHQGVLLLALGGIAYTIGAVFYVAKWPNLKPGIFGYHELFHVMTVLGAGLHFVAVYKLLASS